MRKIILLVSLSVLISCSADNDSPVPSGTLNIKIAHMVDNGQLAFDTLQYSNAAGEQYSITTLRYFLTSFRFFKGGQQAFLLDTVLYVDGRKNAELSIKTMPYGSYDSITFFIGIDPARNIHGFIAPTIENQNMEWPDGMGGGYHFIMMEGHWKDSTQLPGFAIHLGTDNFLIRSGVKGNFSISGNKTTTLGLAMNINEWFVNPHVYSLSKDGVYTMGNAQLMQLIADNGKDVFFIKE